MENPPHPFVLNKFLSSDPGYASFAQELVLDTWDPVFTWEIWRGAVPKLPSAPRMRYPAPKKGKDPSPLVQRIMEVEGLCREEVQLLMDLEGVEALEGYYGIEEPEEEEGGDV